MDALDFFPQKSKETEDDDDDDDADDIDHHHQNLDFHVDVCALLFTSIHAHLSWVCENLMFFLMLLIYRPVWISLPRTPVATDQLKKMMHWKLWMKRG